MPIRRSLSVLSRLLVVASLVLLARPALAGPDFWTLSLVWSPEYCNSNLSSKEPQCVEERFFTVNGLEPKYLSREPECAKGVLEEEDVVRWFAVIPNRARISRVWRSQGACSGLSQSEYFVQMERASRRLLVPAKFTDVVDQIDISREDFKQAFIGENPSLTREALALRCHGRWLHEVQACFTPDFRVRNCGLPENCPEQIRLRPLRRSREGQEPIYR